MVRDNFWLDGIDAASKKIVLQKEIEFEPAEPVTESFKIPGKDGDVVYYDGSYSNVKGFANCYVLGGQVSVLLTDINAWLLSTNGYRKLQTLHEPLFYRLARVVRGAKLDPRVNLLNQFVVEFDCKPYKYYIDGDKTTTFTSSGTIAGPTDFPSLPLITVTGSGAGTITVNGHTLTLADSNGVTLDCELKKAYKGTTNMNSTVSGTYPVLGRSNTVSFTGGVTGLTIKPRWRTI